MASCMIGYYSTRDTSAENIQASYIEILNDPIYCQDADHNILPYEGAIEKHNKPWVPNPEFFSEPEMTYNSRLYKMSAKSKFANRLANTESIPSGEGIKLAGSGINLAGYGISLAGRSKSHRYSLINNKAPEIVPTIPDNTLKKFTGEGPVKAAIQDVQKIAHQVINKADTIISKAPILPKQLKRPLSKITHKKPSKPGSGLRKKLAHKMQSSNRGMKKNLSTFEKRNYIKTLLQRIQPKT